MEIYQKQYIGADEIPFALNEAFSLFNSTFDTNYSLSNVKVSFFTFQTFPKMFHDFCEADFPSWLAEDYTNPSFYRDTQAMALVEEDKAGILINISVAFSYWEWVKALLHELAHIYATQKEYNGKSFYTQCCSNNDLCAEEDMLYIGYTVWKEFIAEYLVIFAMPTPPISLYRYRGEIKRFDLMIKDLKPDSLSAMSLILVAVFTSKEHLTTRSKENFLEILKEKHVLNMDEYHHLIHLIIDHIRNDQFEPQIITDDFIDELGSMIRKIVVERAIRKLSQSPIS